MASINALVATATELEIGFTVSENPYERMLLAIDAAELYGQAMQQSSYDSQAQLEFGRHMVYLQDAALQEYTTVVADFDQTPTEWSLQNLDELVALADDIRENIIERQEEFFMRRNGIVNFFERHLDDFDTNYDVLITLLYEIKTAVKNLDTVITYSDDAIRTTLQTEQSWMAYMEDNLYEILPFFDQMTQSA